MPISEVTFYRVTCDRCGKAADYGEYAAWMQPEGATEMLGDDWTTIDDKFYCDDCRPPDEDDDAYTVTLRDLPDGSST